MRQYDANKNPIPREYTGCDLMEFRGFLHVRVELDGEVLLYSTGLPYRNFRRKFPDVTMPLPLRRINPGVYMALDVSMKFELEHGARTIGHVCQGRKGRAR